MKKQEMDAIHEMRLQGKTASEIGLALGISVNTVRSHIRRHPVIYGGLNCEHCILTKSISRFARNTVTLLETVRELKALGISVYFEEQNIDTSTADGELMLSIQQ